MDNINSNDKFLKKLTVNVQKSQKWFQPSTDGQNNINIVNKEVLNNPTSKIPFLSRMIYNSCNIKKLLLVNIYYILILNIVTNFYIKDGTSVVPLIVGAKRNINIPKPMKILHASSNKFISLKTIYFLFSVRSFCCKINICKYWFYRKFIFIYSIFFKTCK
jgi:hypothetical protein